MKKIFTSLVLLLVIGICRISVAENFINENGALSPHVDLIASQFDPITCPWDFEVCQNDPVFELTGGQPEGGYYSGNGVVTNHFFDPVMAGIGIQEITYAYSDNSGNELLTCNFTITVSPVTTVLSIPDDTLTCRDFSNGLPLPYQIQATAMQYIQIEWTANGSGYFDDANVEDPIYHFSEQDLMGESVVFTVSLTATGLCLGNLTETFTVYMPSNSYGSVAPEITWSLITVNPAASGGTYVAFGNNKFVVVTDNGCASTNNNAFVSNDYGLTWVQKATPGSTNMPGVAYNPVSGRFIIAHRCYEASRNYSYTDNNCNTWTTLHFDNNYRYNMLKVKDYFFSSSYQHTCDRSPNGINWTNMTFANAGTASVTAYSDIFGLYYASDGAYFYTSPDAINWTKRTNLGNSCMIAAGNNVVLAYTYNSNTAQVLLRSLDGLTFQPINSLPAIGNINRIKFINGLFWATISSTDDDTENIMVSYDGSSWEILDTPALVGGNPIDLEIGYDPVQQKNVIIIPCNGGKFLRGVFENTVVTPFPVANCHENLQVCLSDNSFQLNNADPAGGIYTGQGVSDNNFDPASAGPGEHLITYTITNEEGCSDTCNFTITVAEPINDFSFDKDSVFICGQNYMIDAGTGYEEYNWNTGDTIQVITVDNNGWYTCTVSNGGCSATDSIFVSLVNAVIEQNDTTICSGSPLTLSLNIDNQFSNPIRFIKFESYYSEDDGQVNVYEIEAYCDAINVALNKSGYANSYEWGDWNSNGRQAIDGNGNSRWSSNRNDPGPDLSNPHFIVIDLQDVFSYSNPIDYIKLNISGFDNWNQNFSVKTSIDNENWITIAEGNNVTGIFSYLLNNVQYPDYSYLWSNGATTSSITVSPVETSVFSCSISNGISSCTDSVTVTVNEAFNPNLFVQDTIEVCGLSYLLDAGAGYAGYNWNTGASTQTISVSNTDWYVCTVSNGVCFSSDSVLVSLITAGILQNDTTVNYGETVELTLSGITNTLVNGLVGYWPFNGNADDESGNGNNGILNGPSLSIDRFGNPYRAFKFDGVNDWIKMPQGLNTTLNIIDDFCLTFWFKTSTDNHSGLIGFGDNVDGSQGGYLAAIGNGGIGLNKMSVMTDNTWRGGSINLTNNLWHFACINLLENVLTILDNNQIDTMFFDASPPTSFSGMRAIGSRNDGLSGYFNGLIDDIRVYNRALTETEITALFNEGSSSSAYSFSWSTGATTPSITVTPTETTTYYCTFSNGIHSCTDSVTVTVIYPFIVTCSNDRFACIDQPVFELSGGDPAGGTFSGPGVFLGEYFVAAEAGLGYHTITYSVTEGGYTGQCSFVIHVVDSPEVNCPFNFDICQDAGIIQLNMAAPAGGWYEGPGVFYDLFSPMSAGVGDHIITYYYSDNFGCLNSCSFTISVIAPPEMICPAGFSVCLSDPAFILTGAAPAGGEYTINGISGNVFDPGALGAGYHWIEYTYDGWCSNGMCYYTIEVLPSASIELGEDRLLLCNDYENNMPLPLQLSSNVPQYISLQWTCNGSGWFSNSGIPNPLYHFSEADVLSGLVTFTLSVEPSGNCSGLISDQFTVFLPSQLIEIPENWSGISSFIVPVNPNIVELTGPCNENLIVQISIGGLYWPEQGVNTLYNWNPATAYKVKYAQPCCLPLFGNPVTLPSTIYLNVGVNYLPVHTTTPIAIAELFGADTVKIISVVDIYSLQVYNPGFGNLNTLQFLEPGVGYLVYMLQSANITFPISTKTLSASEIPKRYPYRVTNHTPWNEVNNTGSFHLISVEKSGLSNLEEGDFIGAFSSNGICAGMVELSDSERLILPVFGDDPYTPDKEGMEENEYLSFKLYRNSTGEESDLIAVYDPSMPNHDGWFVNYGLSKIIALNTGATSVGDICAENVAIFPNPAHDLLTVVCSSGLRSIKLQNMISQIVYTADTEGSLRCQIDVSKYPEGVYFITVECETGLITTRRVVIH